MTVFDVLSSGSVILRTELLLWIDLVLKAYVFVTGSVAHAVMVVSSMSSNMATLKYNLIGFGFIFLIFSCFPQWGVPNRWLEFQADGIQ